MSDAILVLGMHRSGTSAVAGSLARLGVELGEPLMPGREGDNERGFYENLAVFDLNRRLLAACGSSWHHLAPPDERRLSAARGFSGEMRELLGAQFSDAPLWAVKDPRLTYLLPLWLEVLAELEVRPHCLVVFRRPREVAASLAARNGFSAAKSLLLWCGHNLAAERGSRGLPRVFLSFEALLGDPVAALGRAGKLLGLEWGIAPAAAVDELARFVSPQVARHLGDDTATPGAPRILDLAERIFATLSAADLGSSPAPERCDALGAELEELLGESGLLLEHMADLSAEPARELERLERQLDERTEWLRSQSAELASLRDAHLGLQRELERQAERMNLAAARGRLDAALGAHDEDEPPAAIGDLAESIEDAVHAALLARERRLDSELAAKIESLRSEHQVFRREFDERLKPRPQELREGLLANSRQISELHQVLEKMGRSLEDATASLEQREKRDGALGTKVERLERSLRDLRTGVSVLREIVDWQSGSLVGIRQAQEASMRREAALAAPFDGLASSLGRSADLAEMMWNSKPWKLYLRLGWLKRRLQAWRAGRAARRVRLAGKQATGPGERAPAAAPAGLLPSLPPTATTHRVLIVDHRLPTPDQDAGSLRMSHLIQILQELGFEVTFVPHNLLGLEPYASQLEASGARVLVRPEVRSIEEHLRREGSRYDLAIVCRASVAADCLEVVQRLCPRAKLLFDTVDLQYLRKFRQAKQEGRAELLENARRRKVGELAAARRADATLVVSPVEKEVLAQDAPGVDVHIVSTIHRVHGRQAGFTERCDLLFIAGFEHPPNQDAAHWLVEEILPLIRQELPEVKLYLVGSKPTREVRALASKHVEVTGYVPDVGPYFARCRLSVAPLRYGAGIKGKINQSMAYGLPCVVTPMAAEGMNLEHRVDVMIADDAAAFADCAVELYRDEKLWLELSEAGMRNIERYFSFAAARRGLLGALAAVGHPLAREAGKAPEAEAAAQPAAGKAI